MKLILLLGGIVISFCCSSQDSLTNNILTTKKFVKGIYLTYKEFKENSPSIRNSFNIILDSGDFVRYRLTNAKGKKIRRVYGFSDGIGVYLNAKVYDQTNYFVPLLALGDITYFEDFIGKRNAIASHTGLVISFGIVGGIVAYGIGDSHAGSNPGWVVFIPDDDGNAYALSRKTLISILKQYDQDLLKEFIKEESPSSYKTLMKYLILFNQRNSDWKNR